MNKLKEIIIELKTVLSGSTIDAILPPLLFVIINNILGISAAIISALILSLVLGIKRILNKEPWKYAFGGFVIVSIAAGLALITKNASNYFIGAAVGSGVFFIAAVASLFLGKPMAAYASHLSRGWPLNWFWRDDVKPVYKEVTIFWALFFLMRMMVQIILIRKANPDQLVWANTLLGWPVTLIILISSYIYGTWRLKKLKGPGVEEFIEGKEPPWEGQKKGF
jgi:energy-converting hydrogenase Eha subunit A